MSVATLKRCIKEYGLKRRDVKYDLDSVTDTISIMLTSYPSLSTPHPLHLTPYPLPSTPGIVMPSWTRYKLDSCVTSRNFKSTIKTLSLPTNKAPKYK